MSLEEFVKNITNKFECFYLYTNLYKYSDTDTSEEYKEKLKKLNSFYEFHHIIYFYIKVLLIEQIIVLSFNEGEYMNLNPFTDTVDTAFVPTSEYIVQYLNNTALVCMRNRKSVPHKLLSNEFVAKILTDTRLHLKKYGLCINQSIVYLFDVCTTKF